MAKCINIHKNVHQTLNKVLRYFPKSIVWGLKTKWERVQVQHKGNVCGDQSVLYLDCGSSYPNIHIQIHMSVFKIGEN